MKTSEIAEELIKMGEIEGSELGESWIDMARFYLGLNTYCYSGDLIKESEKELLRMHTDLKENFILKEGKQMVEHTTQHLEIK